MDPSILIPAIVDYADEKGGYVTKTKLLKLLYLIDIEWFRRNGVTFTAFDWIFHKYGPWAPQYERLLSELQENGAITLRISSRDDADTVFVNTLKKTSLSEAFPHIAEELVARRIIEAWADRPIGELLDYVYFHTEPMREAQRGKSIDFGSVVGEEPSPEYKRTSSEDGALERKGKRAEFRNAIIAAHNRESNNLFIEPTYDEHFWNAIETLDQEPD